MQVLQWMRAKSMRVMLFALFLCLIPASSQAGVFISVGFAPPVLPVYVQPPCPQPGWMWTPGYWAYGPDGYYWVPGTWVPAPYEGALWTPPYWGWEGGLYVFHRGYWGPHVGYYGGVNYGFGYMGIGFVGGAWHGHEFAYNTAVVNVNRTVIHNTYIDRTIVRNNTIVNDRHVAYSGGPGGINHRPTPQENSFAHEQHMAPTSFQSQHEGAARGDHASYFNNNHGNPSHAAMERPAGGNERGSFNNNAPRNNSVNESQPIGRPHPEQQHQPQPQQMRQSQPQQMHQPQMQQQHQPQMQQQHQPQPQQMHQPPPQHEAHQPPPQQQHESHQAPPPHNDQHGHR